jgi:integrase
MKTLLDCAVSSVVEHYIDTVGVGGSNPPSRTIFSNEIEESGASDTALTQERAETEGANVKYPKRIKYRGKVLATIYGRCKGRDSYRVAWQVAGRRRMASFASYSLAKRHADGLVKDLSKGSQVTALQPAQARDALAALERLADFYRATGRRVSLLTGISEFVEASAKLGGRTLGEAVTGYLRTVATVKRKDIGEAVTEFLQTDAPRTKAVNGQRAQLSADYANHRKIQLRKFADTFRNTAVCDLSKEHLDAFIGSLADFAPKTRNHYRAAVGQFLKWSVRKDYLSVTHRLGEADGLRPEHANTAEISFYTPRELAALLANAGDNLRPLIAVGGLAGLRSAEMLRLDWVDVWRVPGHIEITAGKAKTRQRRLVEICPALAAWLEPYRVRENGKFWPGEQTTFQEHYGELCKDAEVPRKTNGLRHSFCSFHFALHANENQTAQQAGNSPAMIHAHYKGLATKAEAEKWFNVTPPKSAKNVILLSATAKMINAR